MDEDDQLDRQTAWLRAREALDDCDNMLAMLREREAQGPASTWKPPESERRPSADVVEQQRTQPMHSNGNDYWNKHQDFIEAVINQHVGPATQAWVNDRLVSFAGDIGEETGKMDRENRELVRTELRTAIDAAKAELRAEFQLAIAEARIAALETRLAEAEQRAAPKSAVRLIGHSDAAD